MEFKELFVADSDRVINLFRRVFTESESLEEGESLAQLVSALIPLTESENVACFGAFEEGDLVGSIFLSPLTYPDGSVVYLLSPVAVSSSLQGKGVGTGLIKHVMDSLKGSDSELVVTYGDPAFYGRLGFETIDARELAAPVELSMPFGWQVVNVNGYPVNAPAGKPTCVEPFRATGLW